MKRVKWSLLVVVLVVALGFVSIAPCTASDVNSDDTVMTDDDSAYDTEQYADPDTAEDTYVEQGENYDEGTYQEEGEYVEEPEGEPADGEQY